jgi:hypothetical protein
MLMCFYTFDSNYCRSGKISFPDDNFMVGKFFHWLFLFSIFYILKLGILVTHSAQYTNHHNDQLLKSGHINWSLIHS